MIHKSGRECRQPEFLPTTAVEMARLGWDAIDVLLVTGDAYVDHPAFGAALLGRWLVHHGYRVGVVAQPRWTVPADMARMGRPALFAGVSAGALDSMLAHYTAFRKKRREDAYTPGGRSGARPNRATIVYTGLVRHVFPGLPVVIGGMEASMRRVTHYDFWSDALRASILADSKADVLAYGMAERAVLELARRIERGSGNGERSGHRSARAPLRGISGTAWVDDGAGVPPDAEVWHLPSHEQVLSDPRRLMETTLAMERHLHQGRAWAVQETAGRAIALAPPAAPLDPDEMDLLYGLPFSRRPHPEYREAIPAEEMVRFSVTTHRGCAGGCSFCSLAAHQGRRIASRSAESIRAEVVRLTGHPEWRGSLSDVGGPSANMWGATCEADPPTCRRVSCLWPHACGSFRTRQCELASLLRRLRRVPGVRHVRTASGVRHDLAMVEPAYLETLAREFVGGQLKVAPEHCVDRVTDLMRKPRFDSFVEFLNAFSAASERSGKEQYVVPYLISAFPGCTQADMEELAGWLARRRWRPRQVQCFIPLPGTVASAMYWCGTDPQGRAIYVARTDAERLRQHRALVDEPARRPSPEDRPAGHATLAARSRAARPRVRAERPRRHTTVRRSRA